MIYLICLSVLIGLIELVGLILLMCFIWLIGLIGFIGLIGLIMLICLTLTKMLIWHGSGEGKVPKLREGCLRHSGEAAALSRARAQSLFISQ